MKAILRSIILSIGLMLGLISSTSRAEAPAGDYTIEIDTPVKLYDISGTYDEEFDDFSMHYTLNVDAKGKITGTGFASIGDDFDYLDAAVTFSGSMSTAGTVTRVRLTLKMAGSGSIEGYFALFGATLSVKLDVDPVEHQMTGLGSGRVSVRVPGYGSRSARLPPETFSMELPEDMDGNWSVTLQEVHPVTISGTSLVGTGAILLSNGDPIPFDVSGAYSTRTDQTRFTFKGTAQSRGASLKLTTTTAQGAMQVLKLSGKALGQKLQATAVTMASTAISSSSSGGYSNTELNPMVVGYHPGPPPLPPTPQSPNPPGTR